MLVSEGIKMAREGHYNEVNSGEIVTLIGPNGQGKQQPLKWLYFRYK